MKRRGTIGILMVKGLLVIAMYSALCASGDVPGIEGSANVYFTDNYFWRVGGDGDPHLQYDFGLSTSMGNLGISLSPWVSYDLSSEEVDEVDYIVDLSYSIADAISTGLGWIYYDVTGAEETLEVYGTVSYTAEIGETFSLSPQLTLYYDVMEVKEAYLETSLSVGMLFASLSATIGYDLGQYESESFDSGLTVLQIGISVEYEVLEKITLAPSFTYVLALDDDFDDDDFIGLNIGFGF